MKTNVKRRRMLVVLPLLVIPFLTMAFWALGGGSRKTETAATAKGLNLDLPDARLKEEKLFDKLGFYDKADRDSLKMAEWMRSDPYFKRDTVPSLYFPDELQELTTMTANKFNQRLNTSPYEQSHNNPEDQIMRKLKLLEDEMNKTATNSYEERVTKGEDDQFSSEVDRLEQLLQMSNSGSSEDAEMRQLHGTLDKILDIQHPQRVKERSIQNKDAAYVVRRTTGADTIVKGFYSYSDETELQVEQNVIEAIIATNQTIVNGAVVKFRLLNDVYIQGQLIPMNTLVAGIAMLDGERLNVAINSIRSGKSIYNVKLEVFDLDGLPGIYIPGTINREVAKESLNNSMSLADMTSLDPSLKAQATATGIGAIKSLVSKKSKMVRVQVKAGYKILLNNKNLN